MSPLKFIAYLVGGMFLILALSLLLGTCQGNQVHTSLPSQVVTRTTDTVYLPSQVKYQVKVVPKLVPVHHYHTDTFLIGLPKDSLLALLATRKYQDTLTLTKGLRVAYRAQVRGRLDSLDLAVVDHRPTLLIKDSVHVVETLVRKPKAHSLRLGVMASTRGVSPGLLLTGPKSSLGVYYNVLLPSDPNHLGKVNVIYHHSLLAW